MELLKRVYRWDLYNENGHKIASTLNGCVNKLSLKNCQAIERGYDLDELAEEVFEKRPKEIPYVDEYDFKQGVMVGFQKALSILGDKKFTYNQMVSAITESSISFEYWRSATSTNLNSRHKLSMAFCQYCVIGSCFKN